MLPLEPARKTPRLSLLRDNLHRHRRHHVLNVLRRHIHTQSAPTAGECLAEASPRDKKGIVLVILHVR